MESRQIKQPIQWRGCFPNPNDPPISEQLKRVERSINFKNFKDRNHENTIRRANCADTGAGK